jgi:Cdc6-like AAA superfamily ATPase
MSFLELSDPEHRADVETELVQLAQNIRAWQEGTRPRLSDEAILRTYPGLGSTKTFRRLREGDTEGLVADNHLPKYRGVWAAIEAASGANGEEEIYEDLTTTMECSYAVAGVIPQRGRTRLVLLEGPTGSGKTVALLVVARKYAGQVAIVEAHEGWQSLTTALGDILEALGVKHDDLPKSKSERLTQVIALLRAGRRVIGIDEGHHCTAPVLNAIKTIMNQTDSVFIIAAIETLWRKLTVRSWEEARQLIHNRLYERVKLAVPPTDDVVRFITARVPLIAPGDWRHAAAKIAAMSEHIGRWAFVRRVADRLKAQPDPADVAAMLEAANHIKKTLETR